MALAGVGVILTAVGGWGSHSALWGVSVTTALFGGPTALLMCVGSLSPWGLRVPPRSSGWGRVLIAAIAGDWGRSHDPRWVGAGGVSTAATSGIGGPVAPPRLGGTSPVMGNG